VISASIIPEKFIVELLSPLHENRQQQTAKSRKIKIIFPKWITLKEPFDFVIYSSFDISFLKGIEKRAK
jgi:hypothetical protein